MSEVPTDQDINFRDSSQGDMEHIVAETRAKHSMVLVSRQTAEDFLRDR